MSPGQSDSFYFTVVIFSNIPGGIQSYTTILDEQNTTVFDGWVDEDGNLDLRPRLAVIDSYRQSACLGYGEEILKKQKVPLRHVSDRGLLIVQYEFRLIALRR